ncbi:amidase family protein [Salinibacillus xinjiangensis]|uniref:Amidase n=1 Tax=Salinibacillus xinjiangensis TaxID=1229268 RepID=A0A6G1X5P4_9BACI|nr:amidase family protein [Salinibacillus xinjiangensis]MRG86323.1 amidase [Salinibacillus xinjiangensis]
MLNQRLKERAEDWLVEATIDDIQQALEKEEVTSKELVLMYFHRISQYDQDGVKINSVMEINPDALHIAEALDRERKTKGRRGPLHGIPILLKDNIDTNDKLHTSAGSLALKNHHAASDSLVAKQLRHAGAVILGKANMTEWANFMTDNMPNGYSSRGGQVINPYGPGELDVGGSSSGSGASVAANLVTAAIGTETSGSILSPASSNSVVGIKPTVGLVGRTGIIPISHSQDTAGPLTRTVKDAAMVLSAIAGIDEEDPVTKKNPQPSVDYVSFLESKGLDGMTIGIAKEPYFEHLNEEEMELMEHALSILKEHGAYIVDDVKLPSQEENWDINTLIYEFKNGINAYLQQTEPHIEIKSLKDLIEFNDSHSDLMLKYGQTMLTKSEETSGTLIEPDYLNSLQKDLYLSQDRGVNAVMDEHELDAILFPNNVGAGIPAKAGYPSISVPGGYTNKGKPLGITFTAGAFEEGKLLKIGYAFEQASKLRKPPKLD